MKQVVGCVELLLMRGQMDLAMEAPYPMDRYGMTHGWTSPNMI
jgi:hypothetical protein